MDATSRETYEAITGPTVPHDLEWTRFVRFWQDVADSAEEESDNRLVVSINGHRVVFHGKTNSRVTVDDIDKARRVLADRPEPGGRGRLVAVAIDEHAARIIDFDLDARGTDASTRRVQDDAGDAARHERALERRSGTDHSGDLLGFYDEVARELTGVIGGDRFVVLGHGKGKANAGAAFVARLEHSHKGLAHRLAGVGQADLSSATDADLEEAARRAVGRG